MADRLMHVDGHPVDDIVELLEAAARHPQLNWSIVCRWAAEDIKRLRNALEVAANHMSMTGAPQTTIDAIRNAVRGG